MTNSAVRPDPTVDRFNADPIRSFTMAASLYTDPDVAERERDAIFANSWQWVGHASDVAEAGNYFTASIAGERIFVIRDTEGELRAFFNVCLHRGHSLLEGSGKLDGLITCPYHAWVYESTGALKGARMSERMPDFDVADFRLGDVAVENFCGFIFVHLGEAPEAMDTCYPGLSEAVSALHQNPDTLSLARDSTFDIAGNWKNVGDNLLECYHCHPTHKDFVDLIDMSAYRNDTFERWSIQTGPASTGNGVYEVTSGAAGFTSAFAWPNISFGQLPGHRGIFIFHFVPTGPETTRQRVAYYSPDGEENHVEEAAFDYFNNVLGPEDVALVENVQIGLRSQAYHQGKFICIPDRPEISEHAVHHFQSMVVEALETD
ncbi:MAG: aromatic ring-hydroxylating dioxygenase subunit alpha [Acidimicrobiaceae bacterium]|jgi:carnitine monooxygenase subunit|nr:aromatic ring-hydroxylating dioxygenase subunit alpha [Acidimicrobiaceae bacterium]MBT5580217.1 aromatic ring-hydroxylating dioxygenase subunit alpha [Acidimicrobiaceae bacterium]MBT5851863.1 aromatic ring-hydroxylating dioxygenase subunit alpha [Acidimicrobiaceae bacterium]